MEDMRIYISNPNKDNQEEITGSWFNLPVTEDEVKESFNVDISFEELEISDNELPFSISDTTTITELNNIYYQVEDLNPAIQNAISDLIGYFVTIENLCAGAEDIIHYSDCSDMKEVAMFKVEFENYFGEVSSDIQQYIDYEKLGNDLLKGDNFVISSNGVFEIM